MGATCSRCGRSLAEATGRSLCDACLFPIPDRIGKYEIRSLLGEGGMGKVYEAFQPDLQRTVAIKVAGFGAGISREILTRFQREAQLAAKLVHPNIVQIFDTGFEGDQPYIVMERVEGRSLAESRLDPRRATRVAATIARALHFAHEQGVIHRDIKPSNILLDSSGRVRILDFGLARLLDDRLALTGSGDLLGTPKYMSPEQAFGNPEEVDRRADIYALGVLLYEMWTGVSPFQGATVLATLRKIETESPPPPSAHNPGITPGMDRACLKALAKRKEDRYGTAREFAEALGPLGEPIVRRPVPRFVFVGVAVLLLGIALGGFLLLRRRDDRTPAPIDADARYRSLLRRFASEEGLAAFAFPGLFGPRAEEFDLPEVRDRPLVRAIRSLLSWDVVPARRALETAGPSEADRLPVRAHLLLRETLLREPEERGAGFRPLVEMLEKSRDPSARPLEILAREWAGDGVGARRTASARNDRISSVRFVRAVLLQREEKFAEAADLSATAPGDPLYPLCLSFLRLASDPEHPPKEGELRAFLRRLGGDRPAALLLRAAFQCLLGEVDTAIDTMREFGKRTRIRGLLLQGSLGTFVLEGPDNAREVLIFAREGQLWAGLQARAGETCRRLLSLTEDKTIRRDTYFALALLANAQERHSEALSYAEKTLERGGDPAWFRGGPYHYLRTWENVKGLSELLRRYRR